MKLPVRRYSALFVAVLFASCQQPFVDEKARDSASDLGPSLADATMGPSNASFLTSPVLISKDGDGDTLADQVLNLLNNASYTAKGVGGYAISGTPGYIAADSPLAPFVETQTGDLQFAGNIVGTYTAAFTGYEEMSPQYYAELQSPSGGATLFQRAEHRVSTSRETWNISWVSGQESFSGKCIFQYRSEWYKDVLTGNNSYQIRYGITELSVDFAVAATDSANIGAKVVGKVVLRQPISSTNGVDNTYGPQATISTFGANKKKFLILSALANNTFLVNDADDGSDSYYSGLGGS